MEIKHTIQILTKDIQDIEKLVRNLNNYDTPPQIEIDLAMSKLRNVYDLLSIISKDIKSDNIAGQKAATTPPRKQQQPPSAPAAPQDQSLFETPVKETSGEGSPGQGSHATAGTGSSGENATGATPSPAQALVQPPEPAPGKEEALLQEPAPTKEEVPPQQEVPAREQATQQQTTTKEETPRRDPLPQQEQKPQGQTGELQQTSVQEQAGEKEQKVPQDQSTDPAQSKDKPGAAPIEDPQPGSSAEQAKEADPAQAAEPKKADAAKKTSILAEKFASDRSLNEKIAPGSGHDLSSKLTGEPIDSIKRNIGINDRFLIIRELMEGDNDAFNDLVQKLDAQHHFDEAYSIIQSAFPEQMEHEGVNLLVRLSRRRYLGR